MLGLFKVQNGDPNHDADSNLKNIKFQCEVDNFAFLIEYYFVSLARGSKKETRVVWFIDRMTPCLCVLKKKGAMVWVPYTITIIILLLIVSLLIKVFFICFY